MSRWFMRLADKRFVLFAVLTVVAVFLTLQVPKTFSKQPRSAFKSLPVDLPKPFVPETGYTVQDAKVVYNGNAAPVDANGFTLPGNVEAPDIAAANVMAAEQQKKGKGKGGNSLVYKAKINPQWFANNTRFWYRNDTKNGTKDFVVVDVERGTRQPAFDHGKLADALSKKTATQYFMDKLPFQTIEYVDDNKAIRFALGGKFWQCDLTTYDLKNSDAGPKGELDPPTEPVNDERDYSDNSYEPLPVDELSPDEWAELDQAKGQKKAGQGKKGGGKGVQYAEAKSPDGKWTAFTKSFNVWMRDKDGKETQLTQAGVEGDAFGAFVWAANSKSVVAYRSTPGDNKTVYRIETSPTTQLYAILHEKAYPRAMDKVTTYEMWVVDVDNMKANKVDVDRIDFRGMPGLRWSKDNATFTFEKLDRSRQRFRIIEVNARSGATRNILDEKADSMINHYSDGAKNDTFYLKYLDATGEMIYLSEMDGWKHLYLIEAKTGKLKQMTKGEWVVRRINKMDVQNRQMWFEASGIYPDQDPYLMHFCRVNFDGTGFVVMTGGNGNNTIQYSPDNKYIIATYQRVDMAPAHDVRRVSDGKKICDLEKADVSALEATGWSYPEVFVAKGRDGKTDIWGYVVRPRNYDPTKKYPVIENIYAGPHSSHVRKTFAESEGALQTLANLGFIVVKIDGMGTMNRSRAFHAVCWQNLKDAGFADRILWMKALAAKYAHVDITRVGIYGTSAGGQNAAGAVLLHPEFYKVAVAACGCHDNRLDKSSWNEAWMGTYGPHYEANSNITLAKNLQGHLLLIVGEMDTNVPPESTYRVVDALIKAGKDFDFIAVPGLDHSNGGPHGTRRTTEFFQKHLQGIDPPNRNAVGGMGGMVPKKGKGGEE